MTRKTFWIIFTIAAALRLAFIGRAPLWYDENFTLLLARLPFDRMITATAGDVHPPLWYLIEWIIFHVFPAAPVWIVRLPAAAFSLLALYTLDQLCKVLHLPAHVRTLAVIFMAVLPFQIWYAQEGRMYALLEFLVLYALYAGLTRRWGYFIITAVAMVYTQNYGMIYLAVIALVLFVEDYKSTHAPLTLAAIVTAVAYSPWAYVVSKQMTEIAGRYWIMDAGHGAVLNAIYKQFWASSMLEPGVITSHVLTFAALILGTIYVAQIKPSSMRIILGMAYMPILLSWVISLTWQPILLFRPLIGISPFLYIITAYPFARASMTTNRTLVAACFYLPIFMFGIAGYYQNIPAMKGEGAVSQMLQALHYVQANWQEGDVIYYTDDGPAINLMPYAGDMPQYKLPACDERVGYAPVLGSLSESTRSAIGITSAHLTDLPHTRAWVFAPRSPLHPQCYEDQIATLAPEGEQLITVDDNEYLSSGVWLVEQ